MYNYPYKLFKVNPLPIQAVLEQHQVELVCGLDEQWSYLGHKRQPRWLWYAWAPHLKTVLAYELGPRADNTLARLLTLLSLFTIRLYCTDDWGAYQRLLPREQHLITKRDTQSIERQNLNFRTRLKRLARRTLCFSTLLNHDRKCLS